MVYYKSTILFYPPQRSYYCHTWVGWGWKVNCSGKRYWRYTSINHALHSVNNGNPCTDDVYDDLLVPTIGFSRSSLKIKGYHLSLYDLGGGETIRDIWSKYYAEVVLSLKTSMLETNYIALCVINEYRLMASCMSLIRATHHDTLKPGQSYRSLWNIHWPKGNLCSSFQTGRTQM